MIFEKTEAQRGHVTRHLSGLRQEQAPAQEGRHGEEGAFLLFVRVLGKTLRRPAGLGGGSRWGEQPEQRETVGVGVVLCSWPH